MLCSSIMPQLTCSSSHVRFVRLGGELVLLVVLCTMRTSLSFANCKTSVVPYITRNLVTTFQPHLNLPRILLSYADADLVPSE